MNSKWTGAALALGLAASAGMAHADASFTLTPAMVAPDSRGFSNATRPGGSLAIGTISGSPVTLYNFLDTWSFTLGNNADVGGFVGSLNFTSGSGAVTQGINNIQLRLNGPSGQIVGWQSAFNLTGVQQLFSIAAPSPFVAGTYTLQVRGLLVGSTSSYAGTLQAITPVPLPAALPLMAGGLALFGSAARRRRSTAFTA